MKGRSFNIHISFNIMIKLSIYKLCDNSLVAKIPNLRIEDSNVRVIPRNSLF